MGPGRSPRRPVFSERGSYQPGYLPSLTRVCVVSKLKAWDLSYPLSVTVLQANRQHEHTFDHRLPIKLTDLAFALC